LSSSAFLRHPAFPAFAFSYSLSPLYSLRPAIQPVLKIYQNTHFVLILVANQSWEYKNKPKNWRQRYAGKKISLESLSLESLSLENPNY
jgi:hypothetical protein